MQTSTTKNAKKATNAFNFFIATVTMLLCLFGSTVSAQISGTKNIPGDYATLAAAITDLNTVGVGAGGVNLNLIAGNPETAPAGGYSITTTTGTNANQITITGNGNTITASAALTAGNLNDGIFKLIGADWVTITGFTMEENGANTTPTAVSNNMTEWGIALLYATTTNGAQNNTIQNNTIILNRTYQNTFGIYSNSTHSATTVTTSASATTAAGGNSGLKIYGNNISNVNNGILVLGPTAAADYNTGVDIGGTGGAQANILSNYGTTGTFSGYANVSGTVYGIYLRNNIGFNISYNSITSSIGGVTSGTLRGIYNQSASNTPTGTFTNNINNNTIALTYGVSSGTLQGITVEATNATATSTLNINNNNFTALTASIVTSATITAISTVAPFLAVNINANTFTNISTNTTGSFTFFGHSYSMPAAGAQTLNGNSIVTGFNKTGAGGTVTISSTGGSSPNGSTHTFTNNNFSNITVTGATGITGVNNTDGAGTSPTKTCTGNTFNNWSGGTSSITCISYGYIGATTSSVSNNILTNITGQAAITGINIGSSFSGATTFNLASNTITNLTSSGTGGAVTGITCTNTSTTINYNNNTISTLSTTAGSAVVGISVAGTTTNNVFKNTICNLSGSNASSTVNAILVSSSSTANVSNNRIADLRTTAANAANPLIGISITGGTTLNVYYNTVTLNGTSSGTNFGSSAISVSTTPTVTLRNNIFVNNSTPNGTGLSVAYRRSSATLTTYGAASDRNDFLASTVYTDGATPQVTIASYKALVGPTRDANSIAAVVPFLSTTCGDANFLKVNTASATQIESGGSNISGFADDFENDIRQGNGGYAGTGTGPDIGADEFEGTPAVICNGTPASSSINAVNSAVCTGQGTTLSLSTVYTDLGITYQWLSGTTPGGPYPTTLGTGITQATGNLTSTTYFIAVITCTNGGATFTTAEKAITVNALPTVGVNPLSGAICNPGGTAVTLNGTGASTYSWAPGTGLSGTTGTTVSANPATTTTYTVTGTDANGCVNTSTATVSVSATPTVSITPSAISICAGGSTTLTASATVLAQGTLTNVLSAINSNSATLIASVPGATSFPMDGTGGVNGSSISDGCSDMFDTGNQLNTNSASSISYSDNTVIANTTAFGPGGQHFTRYIGTSGCTAGPATIFYWAADISGRTSVGITGNLGADGSGSQDLNTFTVTANGITYSCFFKRTYGATDPSVNHLFLIPQPNSVTQTMGATTDDDAHTLSNLTGVTRVYYMLFAGAAAGQISVASATSIAQTFVNIIPLQNVPAPSLSYSWSTTETTAAITVTPSVTTTYTATVSSNGCPASATATVTVGELLVGSAATASSPNCAGSNFTVTAHATGGGAPYGYSWSDGVGGVYPNAQTITANLPAGTYTFTATITDACTATTTSSVSVTVNALPTVAVNPTTGLICTPGGSPVSLTASGAATYTWSPTAGLTPTTGSPVSANPASTTTYTVTGTDANGCIGTATSTITVTPAITGATASATPSAACEGASTTFNASANPVGYTMNSNSGVAFIDISPAGSGTGVTIGSLSDDNANNITIPSFSLNGVTYTTARVGTNGAVVLGSTSGAVSAGNAALPSTANSAGNVFLAPFWDDLDIQTGAVIYTATQGNIFIIQFNNMAHDAFTTGSVTFEIQLNLVTGAIHYVYTDVIFGDVVEDAGVSATVGLQLSSTNAIQYSFNTASLVNGQSISFAPIALNYSWSGPNGFTSAVQNPSIAVLTPADAGTYTVTISSPGFCPAIINVPLTVNPIPAAPGGNNSVQCGTAVPGAFVTTGGGGGGFKWYDAQTGGTLLQTGGATYTSAISITTHFWVSESNGTCESARTEVIASVNLPDAVSASSNGPVCPNSQLTLTATVTGNTNGNVYVLTWAANPAAGSGIPTTQSGGNATFGTPASTVVTPTVSGTYTYTVTAVDATLGCTTTAPVTVTVNAIPAPVVITPAVPAAICAGSSVTLNGVSGGAASATTTSGVISIAIPDNNATGISNTLAISGVPVGAVVDSVIAEFNITHGFDQDILVNLTAPNNQIINLVSGGTGFISGGANFTNTRISSDNSQPAIPTTGAPFTGTFRADKATSGFELAPSPLPTTAVFSDLFTVPNGNWILKVEDDEGIGTGTLNGWTIKVAYHVTGDPITWQPGSLSGGTIIVSPTTTTTYTATATNANGCTNFNTVTVTVNQLPPAPSGNNGTDQCGTGLTDASVSSNNTTDPQAPPFFRWYNAPTGGTLLQSSTSTTYTTAISVTTTWYVAEVSANGCEGSRVQLTSVVSDPDALTVTTTAAPAGICIGSSFDISSSYTPDFNSFATFDLTATGGAASGVTGTVSLTPNATGSDPYTITPTAVGTYTYTITAFDPDKGCTSVATVSVTVSGPPSITSVTATPTTTCSGGAVTLNASSGGTLTPFAQPFETFPVSNFTTTGSGVTWSGSSTYFIEGTGAVQNTYASNANGSLAMNAGISLVGSTNPKLTFSHIAALEGCCDDGRIEYSIDGGTNWLAFPSSAYTGTGTVSETGIVAFARASYSDWNSHFTSSSITYPAAPATSFWKNETINLSAYTSSSNFRVRFRLTSDGSVEYAGWKIDNVKISYDAPDITNTLTWNWNPGNLTGPTQTVHPTGTTTYTVTAATAAGCTSAPSTVTVTVVATSADITATPNTPVCAGTSVTLNGLAGGGAPFTYSWSDGTATVYPATASITVTPAVTTTYTLTVTDACNNQATATTTVDVNPLPNVAVTPTSASFCTPLGTPIALNASGASTYSWSPSAGLSASTGASVTANPTTTTNYTVTGTDGNGCTNTATAAITVNVNPTATASATPNPVCDGSTVTLNGTGNLAANYSVASIPVSIETPSGTPTVLATGGTASVPFTAGNTATVDDAYWNNITLPFSFTFYGTSYNAVRISSNGNVQFGAVSAGTGSSANYSWVPQTIPTAGGNLDNFIAGPWNDQDLASTPFGTLRYYVNGVAPNRKFVVSYEAVKIFSQSDLNTSQIILNENGTIDVLLLGGGFASTGSKVIGIENANGTLGTAAPGRNLGTWTTTANEAWRFSPAVSPTFSYLWSGPNSFSSTDQNPTIPNFGAANAGAYSLVVTNTLSNCSSASASTAAVTITPRPTGVLSGANAICAGSSTTSTFSIAVTGTGPWSGTLSPGAIPFSGSTSPISVTVPASASPTTYTIATLNGALCSAIPADLSGSATVSITPRPTGVISGDATYPTPTSTPLSIAVTGTGPWSGTLNPGAIPFSGSSSPIIVNVTPSNTTTYTIATLGDALCTATPADLSGSATITIVTLSAPTVSVVHPTCAVATGTITVTSPLGAAGGYSIGGPYQPGNVFSGVAPGLYQVTFKDENGFTSPATPTTVDPQPFTPTTPVITGVVNVCPYLGTGQQQTYTATTTGNGTITYSWTLPPNVTLVAGGGTNSANNFVTVTFAPGLSNPAQANKQIRVTATNQCGTSGIGVFYLLTQAPVTPGPITGPTNVCTLIGTGNTATYTINKVLAATGYSWSVPSNATFTSVNGAGVNDTSIVVTFPAGFAGGTLSVAATNGCGSNAVRTLSIVNTPPSTPALISGPTNACGYIAPGTTAATYSIPAVPFAVTYNWNAPVGSTVTPISPTSISVIFPVGFTSGTITVSATNGCGTGGTRSLTVTRLNPVTPSVIDVIQTHFCGEPGGRKYTYTLASMPANATSVIWTVPAAATNTTNLSATSIEVTYPDVAVNGTVTAQATNGTCSSSVRSTQVKLPACPTEFAGSNNGGNNNTAGVKGGTLPTTEARPMEVKIFPNPTVSDFKLEVLTSRSEEINVRVMDNLGRLYKSFKLMPYQTIALGAELKAGSYLIEVRQGIEVKTTKLIKF